MQAERYFGTYARFETKSKKDAAALLGADNLVGDVFELEFIVQDKKNVAWLKNRFGGLIGYLDEETSRTLSILVARGWNLKAILSFIAFTDAPDPGHYWGQVALVCYENELEQPMSSFIQGISARLADGVRPDVSFGDQAVQQIVESEGSWQPKDTVPLPEKKPGTVIMKSRRKMSEKLIEQGRKGNKGCYAVSWIFLLAIVALALFGLKSCGML